MAQEAKPSPERLVAGRYALFDEIGVGGMASVHIGRFQGAAGFARTVAIKRLHPSFVRDADFVSMLIDEARLASRIRHPNVIQTLDVVLEHREIFVVMEYIHGESLAHLMRQVHERKVRIPYRTAVTIIVDALLGLHAAHEITGEDGHSLELVHRDISPQNILVGTDGLARVLDFGIAKSTGSVHVSLLGGVKGKFAYIAPEQIHAREVGKRADVYSASVVLWEALTGLRLFHGDSPEATLAKVMAGDIPAPSTAAKGLPRGLDAIVMRGLARDPNQRYASAAAMATELETCCRLESHRTVAEWVESVDSERLKQRAETIARIEREFDAGRSSDLRELVGHLVRKDSIVPNERPTLAENLRPKRPTDDHVNDSSISGAHSIPAAAQYWGKYRRWIVGSAATALLLGAAALLSAQAFSPMAPTAVESASKLLRRDAPVPAKTLSAPPIASTRPLGAPATTATVASASARTTSAKATPRRPSASRGQRGNSRPAVNERKSASPFSGLGGRL